MKILKFAVIVFTLVFVLSLAGICNADSLQMDVRCPEFASPGGTLDVDLQVLNYSGYTVHIRSLGTGIIGNPAGSGGFPVIYGPWNTSMNINIPPGNHGPYSIRITDSVDASLEGTIVMATIMVLDENGWTAGGGACAVAVEP